jgi:hypothetical protein
MNEAERKKAGEISRRVNQPGFELDEDQKKILASGQVKAGYKIQINFGPNRSALKEFGALLSFYGSGKHFHGGGDDLCYVCLDRLELMRRNMNPRDVWKYYLEVLKKKVEDHGCGRLITGDQIGGGVAFCNTCQKGIVAENLVNPLYFWGTTGDLATLVAEIFRRVTDDNADVYCKYDPTDIRYLTMQKEKGSEAAHRLRGMFIYPLARILQDTTSGATLDGRFKAFFNA